MFRKDVFGPELLESRTLLSFATLGSSGTLSVADTSGSDQITIRNTTFGTTNFVEVERNNVRKQFLRSDVKRVFVRCFNGDDLVVNNTLLGSTMFGGNGNDTLAGGLVGGGDCVVHGEAGNDQVAGFGKSSLYGDEGNDFLIDGPANDHLFGGPGNDRLEGRDGNDTLDGGLGADDLKGGAGTDRADYSSRSENLSLSIDNNANDGAAGEGDNIHSDIENVFGGSGNDRIIGNPFANSLKGNGGNDTIYGGKGNDTLDGGSGHDQLFGQDGDDTLRGKDGSKDTLDGGAGADSAQRDNSASVKDQVLNIENFV